VPHHLVAFDRDELLPTGGAHGREVEPGAGGIPLGHGEAVPPVHGGDRRDVGDRPQADGPCGRRHRWPSTVFLALRIPPAAAAGWQEPTLTQLICYMYNNHCTMAAAGP
jgi:hypothetical protein